MTLSQMGEAVPRFILPRLRISVVSAGTPENGNGAIRTHFLLIDDRTPSSTSVINRLLSTEYTVAYVMISGIWRVSHWLINGAFLLPVGVLLSLVFWPDTGRVLTLWDQGMPLYLLHTLVLVGGTVTLSLLIGLPAAWIMARYHFAGKRHIAWMLCLPLAMPAFLIAGFYADALGANGPIHALFSDIGWFGANTLHGRSLAGACLVMALAFYPYVYLPVRHALETQPAHWLQAAQLLKLTPRQVFWRLSFPLLRPTIAMSAVLVAVETLNDYGTATLLQLPTLTTMMIDMGVLKGDAQAVAHWTLALLPLLVLLAWLGLRFRRRQLLCSHDGEYQRLVSRPLTQGKARLMMFLSGILAMVAMGLPLGRLVYWELLHITERWERALMWAALHSLVIAGLSALFMCLMAVPFLLSIRRSGLSSGRLSFVLAQCGYVIPAAALAMGIAVPLISLDNGLHALASMADVVLTGPIFSSVWLIMVAVYSLKFSRFVLEPLSVRMAHIPQMLDQACISYGLSQGQRWSRVYYPLLKPQILLVAMIVFFESMKELNAAFLFRTLGLETLPTYVFRLASDNQLEWGALPALLLVAIGCAPMLWFQRVWKGNSR